MFEWPGDLSVDDRCHCCQFPAPLRHVVWFGEMPLGMDDIYRALSKADFFVAIGTSGHVYPAAGFVHEARLGGAYAMELNRNRAKWRASSTKTLRSCQRSGAAFCAQVLVGKVARADRP